jgi:nitroreductase
VPDHAIPQSPPQTTVPGRDFGRTGDLPVAGGHDRPAVFVVLYGAGDAPIDWLKAGEALSALWLVATELGVSVLPLSAALELPDTRAAVQRLLSGLGHPYLALRLGHRSAADPATPHAPRLPVDQIIEYA